MLLKNRNGHQMDKFILLSLCVLVKSTGSHNLTCNSRDLTALVSFSNSLDSGINGWGSNSGADCCKWDGVTCEFVSPIQNISRVVSLELPNKRLKGKLNKSLVALDYLRVLNLSNNFFWDHLPSELFKYQFLEVLDLSFNDFTGNLTVDFSLPSLKFLDLSNNMLRGCFNEDICGLARRLQVLNLSRNYFTGIIPATIRNCNFLEVLSLGSNYFEGSLPEDLFRLPKLRQLTLQNNWFSGLLTPTIDKLHNIVEFDISLNGFYGTFPDVFSNLQKLKRFSANSNRFTGSLPPSLSSSASIVSLNVRNNSLNGSIVLNCSYMVSLTSLALSSNSFSGQFPEDLSSCKKLTFLDLSRNKFSSQLPESYKNISSLSYLSLSNCSLQNLTATLGILQHCKNLSFLVLTNNFPNEVMPADNYLQFNNLRTLVIANCPLTGTVPNWLQSCTKLQLLDLSWNQLTGYIPRFFSKMKLLFYLDLSRNMLSEEIPTCLTKLESLINQTVPLEELSKDFYLFFKRSSTARGLRYNQIQRLPPTLDLSSNYLTGPILEEFGSLKQLHVLNVSNNNLSGHIPESLSNMASLETLDFSNNSLIGSIPPSFARLSFLSKFSVAFNKLSGHIPTGGQLSTFPESSFAGNDDLCDYESKLCLSVPGQKPGKNPVKPEDEEDSVIGIPFAIGGVAGFILVVAICYLSGWLFPKEVAKKRIEIAWQRLR